MTLVTRSSFNGKAELQVGKKMMKLKKDVYMNDAGKIAEAKHGEMPKGWAKGKLLGVAGSEVSDAQAKEWGLGTKAKSPAENKGK
tara:strand:- start:282 stop:536 length:255 start_codon:yes stop_codon:yes gene_type:complete